jgi:RNA polymerase sigma-70 factor, ECF subfamily
MPPRQADNFHLLLGRMQGGDAEAASEFFTLVYQDLRRLAQLYLRHERPDHTLPPTALVHEAYLRLIGEERMEYESRDHFFVTAARLMRRILIDYARRTQTEKRGGGEPRLSLDEVAEVSRVQAGEIVALNDALSLLESLFPRASRVVELRFFAGLTESEAAEVLGISLATLKRDWVFAKVWLYDQLAPPDGG